MINSCKIEHNPLHDITNYKRKSRSDSEIQDPNKATAISPPTHKQQTGLTVFQYCCTKDTEDVTFPGFEY